VQWFEDSELTITVAPDETFGVVLSGNPTTGYAWHARVDTDYLELLAQEFEPEGAAMGAGGRELFRFRAHQRGETAIAFEYRRPWASEVRAQQSFQVIIA
jgi:inhibitor of cysteine peptidase